MYLLERDEENGKIKFSQKWNSNEAPLFNNVGDEFIYSYINVRDVQTLKSFTFKTQSSLENRYLVAQYRISRDGKKWSEWLSLESNITNFPPFSSKFPLFLDIKFIRSGSSNIGSIKLLSYELIGNIERNVVDGESVISLNNQNNVVIIKPPYIYKVFKLDDIEIISDGTIDTDFTIKWRFSQDYGRSVTDWEFFTKENVISKRISPIRFFQVEYLVELKSQNVRVWDINLIGDFQNVSLDYLKTNLYGIREDCNCLKLGVINGKLEDSGENKIQDVNKNCVLPQLSEDDKNNLFKPYNQQAATELLDKLSNDSNELFGHEIVYFLTDPDKNGIDYTFNEYQLYNYVSNALIKASVENNQFPENNGAINQFDLSLFDSFEIHVPKKLFKDQFGPDKRPSKEDFLWFCEINRMFTVEHSQSFRGFNNNAIYYKLMLKKYNQKSNIIGVNQTITEKLQSLTKNSTIDELFGLEIEQDKLKVANKDQHRPLTQDPIRQEIKAKIIKESIENGPNVISKTHYDLSSVAFSVSQSTPAVIYKNVKNYFKVSDNIGFICWFNIFNWTLNDNYRLISYYDSQNSLGFDFNINESKTKVKINGNLHEFELDSELEEDTWYCYVGNIDQRQRKLSQWIYKRNVDNESDAELLNSTKLRKIYYSEQDITPQEFLLENEEVKLMSGDMRITNIRLFVDIIPEDTHNKILNQYIIRDDSKYLIFADNANKTLTLPNFPLSQIGPGEV